MASNIATLFRRWFSSIDRVVLFSVLIIIGLGIWISIASTPAVAVKIGVAPFHFVKQHIIIVPIVLLIILGISILQTRHIRLLSLLGYFACIGLIICTLVFGTEIKGARRWLNIFGFSLQPSEFLKPIMSVITAWLISEQYMDRKFPGILLSFIAILFVVPIMLFQPDVGMSLIILGTWMSQLFISGLSVAMISAFVLSSIATLTSFYFLLPHFTDRIDKFLSKEGGEDVYQIKRSLEAFKSGGWFGKGPGEGVVKTMVPDSHSDFVFSVIGEEFGFITCFAIIALFMVIIIRSLLRIMNTSNMFVFSAVFGILFQIMLQVFINISTALSIIPTKGMTLPFISYGGSSMLSSAIAIGVLIALTRRTKIM